MAPGPAVLHPRTHHRPIRADRRSTSPEVTTIMPTRPYDPWRDADGTPVLPQCRIQQIAVGKQHGALPSRLHRQGQVLGRGTTRLIVQFDHEHTPVSIRPHLVRVLTTPGDCSASDTLTALRDAPAAGPPPGDDPP